MELIRVTDLTGKSVYSEVLSGETEFVLDLSTLAQGVYFVQVDGSRPIKLVRR